MKQVGKKLAMLLTACILLVMGTETAFGQVNGKKKSPPPSKRVVYLGEEGIFLNENQEEVVLEKLLWKEQYREDAVSMYYVNMALEERMNDLIFVNERLSKELQVSEAQLLSATSKTTYFKEQLDQERLINEDLKKSNRNLKTALGIQTGVGVIAIGSLVYILAIAQ